LRVGTCFSRFGASGRSVNPSDCMDTPWGYTKGNLIHVFGCHPSNVAVTTPKGDQVDVKNANHGSLSSGHFLGNPVSQSGWLMMHISSSDFPASDGCPQYITGEGPPSKLKKGHS